MGEMEFDYYYGQESEQFRFFRIPKMLFEKECFKGLSCEAKLLYGLMLDQMSLSQRNGWVDEENRTYIIFTVNSVSENLGCSKDKARKLAKELEGIGLIERKRRGQGRPDVIYVKNFVKLKEEKPHSEKIRDIGRDFSEYEKSAFLNTENPPSRKRKIRLLEGENSAPNDTNNNKTEFIETYPITSIHETIVNPGGSDGQDRTDNDVDTWTEPTPDTAMQERENVDIAIQGGADIVTIMQGGADPDASLQSKAGIGAGAKGEVGHGGTMRSIGCGKGILPGSAGTVQKGRDVESVIRQVKDNISFDEYMEILKGVQRNRFGELFEIIVDMVAGDRETVPIGNAEYPQELVMSRFLKLKASHLLYVMDRVEEQAGTVRNMHKYLVAALYNAPTTMGSYYAQLVQRDMAGGWGGHSGEAADG